MHIRSGVLIKYENEHSRRWMDYDIFMGWYDSAWDFLRDSDRESAGGDGIGGGVSQGGGESVHYHGRNYGYVDGDYEDCRDNGIGRTVVERVTAGTAIFVSEIVAGFEGVQLHFTEFFIQYAGIELGQYLVRTDGI